MGLPTQVDRLSMIQSAKLNGHGPCRYLKDLLPRLSAHLARRIAAITGGFKRLGEYSG